MGMNSELPVPTIVSGMISRSCGQKVLGKDLDGWYPTCVLAESKHKAASMSQAFTARLQNFFSLEDDDANRRDDMMVVSCSL